MEEILVFKGKKVEYCSRDLFIKCESDDDCFKIELVAEWEVKLRGGDADALIRDHWHFRGNELWSDGENWIIRYNSQTQLR